MKLGDISYGMRWVEEEMGIIVGVMGGIVGDFYFKFVENYDMILIYKD